MSAVTPVDIQLRHRVNERRIGRRAAAVLLAILLAALTGAGVLLAHDIRQREQDRARAHLGVALGVALNEIAREATRAQTEAATLAAQPAVQRALARSDTRALARLTAAVPGASASPVDRMPPVESPLVLHRDVRVLGGGKVLGTVRVAVPLDGALLAQLRSLAPMTPGEGFLFARGSRIAAAPPALQGAPLPREARSARLGGDTYLVSQADVVRGGTPIRLAALAPASEVDAPIDRSIRRLIVCLVATLATLLLFARMLARPVLRPLRALAREAASSGTDHLTQLANRRAFAAAGARELARASRSQLPVAIALIDIDDFKHVNDTYGHKAGDEVLRGLADVLRAETREFDLAVRYGGEEFVLLLPGTDTQGAHEAAERVRLALAARKLGADRTLPEGVTVSVGIAAGVETTLEELLEAADQALYRAKGTGKNTIVVDGNATTAG